MSHPPQMGARGFLEDYKHIEERSGSTNQMPEERKANLPGMYSRTRGHK